MVQPLSMSLADDAVGKIRKHLATLDRLNSLRVEALSHGALRIAGSRVHHDGLLSDPLDRDVFQREASQRLTPEGKVLPLIISQELQLAFVGRKTKAPRPRVDHVLALKREGSEQITLDPHINDYGLARCIRLTLGEERPQWACVSTLIAELRGVLSDEVPSAEAYAAESLLFEATTGHGARLLEVLGRWPEAQLPPTSLEYVSQTIEAAPYWGAVLALSGYGDRQDRLDLELLSHAPRVERTLAQIKDRVWKAGPRLEKKAEAHFVAILTQQGLRADQARRAVSATLSHRLNTFVGDLELSSDARASVARDVSGACTIPFDVVFRVTESIHSNDSLVLHARDPFSLDFACGGALEFLYDGDALEHSSRLEGKERLRDMVSEAIEDEDTYYDPDWE